eukprot:CAMPEP_0172328006 /NCGR_PEP_ID=MMETSP1058-20130122/60125_1 /TAXON_ID=83371 /ORGANISM="Detonula confervacea, Strain CCMP 353" /LENGTH=755 /DNA_ID=CAMNT_0013045103 /DNA_START=1508 /DNA_END=3772 /DNA_ORIENTATION=-
MTKARQESDQYGARVHAYGFEESEDAERMVVSKQRPYDPGSNFHDIMKAKDGRSAVLTGTEQEDDGAGAGTGQGGVTYIVMPKKVKFAVGRNCQEEYADVGISVVRIVEFTMPEAAESYTDAGAKDGRSAVLTDTEDGNNGARQEGVTYFVTTKKVERQEDDEAEEDRAGQEGVTYFVMSKKVERQGDDDEEDDRAGQEGVTYFVMSKKVERQGDDDEEEDRAGQEGVTYFVMSKKVERQGGHGFGHEGIMYFMIAKKVEFPVNIKCEEVYADDHISIVRVTYCVMPEEVVEFPVNNEERQEYGTSQEGIMYVMMPKKVECTTINGQENDGGWHDGITYFVMPNKVKCPVSNCRQDNDRTRQAWLMYFVVPEKITQSTAEGSNNNDKMIKMETLMSTCLDHRSVLCIDIINTCMIKKNEANRDSSRSTPSSSNARTGSWITSQPESCEDSDGKKGVSSDNKAVEEKRKLDISSALRSHGIYGIQLDDDESDRPSRISLYHGFYDIQQDQWRVSPCSPSLAQQAECDSVGCMKRKYDTDKDSRSVHRQEALTHNNNNRNISEQTVKDGRSVLRQEEVVAHDNGNIIVSASGVVKITPVGPSSNERIGSWIMNQLKTCNDGYDLRILPTPNGYILRIGLRSNGIQCHDDGGVGLCTRMQDNILVDVGCYEQFVRRQSRVSMFSCKLKQGVAPLACEENGNAVEYNRTDIRARYELGLRTLKVENDQCADSSWCFAADDHDQSKWDQVSQLACIYATA